MVAYPVVIMLDHQRTQTQHGRVFTKAWRARTATGIKLLYWLIGAMGPLRQLSSHWRALHDLTALIYVNSILLQQETPTHAPAQAGLS